MATGLEGDSKILLPSATHLAQRLLGVFGGPMARATWAWRPLQGSPRVLKYPYCHQTTTQSHPTGYRRGSGKSRIFEIFQVPQNSLHNRKDGRGASMWTLRTRRRE